MPPVDIRNEPTESSNVRSQSEIEAEIARLDKIIQDNNIYIWRPFNIIKEPDSHRRKMIALTQKHALLWALGKRDSL